VVEREDGARRQHDCVAVTRACFASGGVGDFRIARIDREIRLELGSVESFLQRTLTVSDALLRRIDVNCDLGGAALRKRESQYQSRQQDHPLAFAERSSAMR
jgi:hypothetical protein